MPGRDAALHGREFESKTPKRETRKLAIGDALELVSPPRDFFLHKKNGASSPQSCRSRLLVACSQILEVPRTHSRRCVA